MRVLCLHGRGTSAAIFRSQTAALRAKLNPDEFEFDFVDGPFRCDAAPGVEMLFEPGSYAWWPENTLAAIRDAHRWLDDYLAAHGPYDLAMGFSQGCLLISSYLMFRAHESGGTARPPFGGAIFICGGVSLPILEHLGLAVSERARDVDRRSMQALQRKAERLREFAARPETIRPGVGLWDDTSDLLHTPGAPLPPLSDVFGLDFTTFPPDAFLRGLPTVHVYGAKDPRAPSGMQLAYFCPDRTVYDHGGGHDIPRTSAVSLKISWLIEQLARDVEAARTRAAAAEKTA